MALRIRFAAAAGNPLAAAVERLADGLWLDWGDGTLKASDWQVQFTPLAVGSNQQAGQFSLTVPTPAPQWPDGRYSVVIQDTTTQRAIATLAGILRAGNDCEFPAVLAAIRSR